MPQPRAVLESGPSHGTLDWSDTGAFTYTPEAGFHGEDSFTYKVNDGRADSNVATVTITVDPVLVTLSGPDAADEGQTKHYSFTTSDPGANRSAS